MKESHFLGHLVEGHEGSWEVKLNVSLERLPRLGNRGVQLMKTLVTFFGLLVLVGCTTGPESNRLEVRKGSIIATGSISPKNPDRLEWIGIDLTGVNLPRASELWIALQGAARTKVSSITVQFLKERTAREWIGKSRDYGGTTSYFLEGYAFRFDNDKLIALEANRFGFPPDKQEAKPRIGLLASGASLTLPCSWPDFASVFGKPDNVVRGRAW